MATYTGHHIIAEITVRNSDKIKRVTDLKPILEAAVVKAGLTKLHSTYHQFEPFGVTGYILLAESHIAFHSWPEKNYVSLDVYTCGPPQKARAAMVFVCNHLDIQKIDLVELKRGKQMQKPATTRPLEPFALATKKNQNSF